MAIAVVQSVTFQGDAVSTKDVVLPNVVAGNFLAIAVSVFLNPGPIPNTAPTDDKSNTWNTTTPPTAQNSNYNAFIFYAMNVAAGTTTITMDFGTGFYVSGAASEFSGLATTSTLDVQADNSAASTTPTSGTTGATAQADELILVSCAVSENNTNVSLDVPATTGYTSLFVEQNSSAHIGHASDYKIVGATGTQSAAWGTLAGSFTWAGKIATFIGAVSSAPTASYTIRWRVV